MEAQSHSSDYEFSLLSPSHLLNSFQNGSIHVAPDVLQIVHLLVRGTLPDLELEYAPGFHCFPIPSNTAPPFKSTNLVVTYSAHVALVVDPGANDNGKPEFLRILRKLRAIGITQLLIFITHHHKDHWEGMNALADPEVFQENQITVLGHPSTLQRLKFKYPMKEVVDSDTMQVGNTELVVIHTPGHTDGSLSLFHKNTGYIFIMISS